MSDFGSGGRHDTMERTGKPEDAKCAILSLPGRVGSSQYFRAAVAGHSHLDGAIQASARSGTAVQPAGSILEWCRKHAGR